MPPRLGAWGLRPSRLRAGPDADLAVADDVAHLAGAAVEDLAGLQSDARAAFAHADRDAPVVAAVGADARRFGRGFELPFAVDPDGRGAARALDVAVEARG